MAQYITPTWGVTFDTKSDLEGFTIIDANGDAHMYEGTLRGGWSWMQRDGIEDFTASVAYYCDYHNAADDWLITPGIKLTPDRTYTFSFEAYAANIYPEKFELFMGNAATAEAMTTQLIAPTTVDKGELQPFSVELSVAEEGIYYVGLHAISDRNQFILDIKNMKIEAGILPSAPAPATDVTATPDPAGGKKATLSFTLPTAQSDGTALTEITKVEIHRGLQIVQTFDDVTPGQQMTYTDVVPQTGLFNYSIVAFNANGDGAPATVTVFVGYDAPTPPVNPHVVDKGTSIDLVWEQSLGQHGGLIKRSDMQYYIYDVTDEGKPGTRIAAVDKGKLLYNIKMNTTTGEQHLLTYIMMAANSQGLSAPVETKGFLVGKPLDYPFSEQFEDMGIDNFWWVSGQGLGYENQYAGFVMANSSCDEGQGSLMFNGFLDDDIVTLHSAKVSLAGATHPWLAFSHKAMPQSEVVLNVNICRPDGTVTTARSIDYRTSTIGGWQRELVDLTEYMADSYVTVEFVFTNYSDEKATMTYIDGITIGEMPQYDLTIDAQMPDVITATEEATAVVTVRNNGTEPIEGYTLTTTFTAADTEVSTASNVINEALQPMEARQFNVTCTPSRNLIGKTLSLQAVVTMPEGITDANADDNIIVKGVTIGERKAATAEDVTVCHDETAGTMLLEWKAPADPSVTVTEGFEGYEPWLADAIGDWKLVDRDGGIGEQLFQGYVTGLEDKVTAFTTFSLEALNPGMADTNEEFLPYHGKQCAAALFGHDGFFNYRDQDNWIISPLLSEKSQRVTLYAGNYDAQSPETFEIMVSFDGNEPDDFQRVGAERRVADGKWHPFTATLPAGARYFAVHHNTVATDSYMFKLDDITFTKAMDIDHYIISWNGEQITETTEMTFTDTPTADRLAAADLYEVSAVYADGTIAAPVRATVVDGIATVVTDSTADGRCYNLAGQRISTPSHGIYILGGRKHVGR